MHIYLNTPANFHPDPIWNDEGLGLFEEVGSTRRRTRWVAIWDQFQVLMLMMVIMVIVVVVGHYFVDVKQN